MTSLPSKADLDGSSAGHNQGVFKAAIGALRDFLAGIAGTAGTPDDAINAMRMLDSSAILNLSLTPSIGAGAITMNAKTRAGAAPAASDPVMVAMRNATAGSGDFNLRKITAAVALTISSGSTLGLGNSDQNPIYWYLIDNAGALELAVSAKWFGTFGIVSTTAEGGAGAADSATVMYSATARANVPYRCIGVMTAPQTAAGTWAALPTSLQLDPRISPLNPTTTVYTSGSGTYTVPAGVIRLRVRVVGAGAGGEGGGTSGGAGTGGGNTSFGTVQGNGGAAGGSGGTGGSASGGDINVVGGAGQSRPNNSSLTFGGIGGGSILGGGGAGGDNGTSAGSAGGNYGGGGGGGGSNSAGTAGRGGGAAGYTEKIIVAPAASYAYAIGAGGTAGAAGTGGTAGGAGAGGLIIIEEYYS